MKKSPQCLAAPDLAGADGVVTRNARQRNNWAKLWEKEEPQALPWGPCIRAWALQAASPVHLVLVTGKALERMARRSLGKAAGVDGWQSCSLLLLPEARWTRFADLLEQDGGTQCGAAAVACSEGGGHSQG